MTKSLDDFVGGQSGNTIVATIRRSRVGLSKLLPGDLEEAVGQETMALKGLPLDSHLVATADIL